MNNYPEKSPVQSISVIQPDEPQYQYRQDQVMTPEQFTQIFEAILEGKYSWACVLTLKFTGYNPLHYIPYRTYKRLLKENNRKKKHQNESIDHAIDQHPEISSYNADFNFSRSASQSAMD